MGSEVERDVFAKIPAGWDGYLPVGPLGDEIRVSDLDEVRIHIRGTPTADPVAEQPRNIPNVSDAEYQGTFGGQVEHAVNLCGYALWGSTVPEMGVPKTLKLHVRDRLADLFQRPSGRDRQVLVEQESQAARK